MRAIPLLGAFAVLIAGQDTKNVVLPPNGNDSSLEIGDKIEPMLQSDMMRNTVLTNLVPPQPPPLLPPPPPQPQSMLPSDYFFPVPQRTFLHHRSENVPYGYEYPNVGYPLVHSTEHSVAPSSKQLVIVSFIGLLLLLAIIQNTLSAIKRKDAIMGLLSSREKRDVYTIHDFRSIKRKFSQYISANPKTPEEEEILNNDARVRCIQRTICLENRKLFRDLGTPGKMLAKYLTKSIEKSLKPSSGWDRLVKDAGVAGIQGEDCNVLYRDCDIPIIRKMRKTSENVVTNIKDPNSVDVIT